MEGSAEDVPGNISEIPNLQILILGALSDLIVNAGSIVGAFVVVGCVGVFMIYIVNGIFVVGYILIQLLIGDGRTQPSLSKSSIYQLIYDQILLHRLWGSKYRSTPASKSNNLYANRKILIRR